MIDHLGFPVADYARSRAFYVDVLAPLGFGPVMDVTREQSGGYEGTGFGPPGRPQFWIGSGEARGGSMHVAFEAGTRAAVDAFHKAAIAAGARDNGAPGLRTITRTTTAHSCSTRTATTSKPCAIPRSDLPRAGTARSSADQELIEQDHPPRRPARPPERGAAHPVPFGPGLRRAASGNPLK
jgi:catechol 2,3-dioxygenase-like lactoylglutathione lyase family enzyme